MQQNESVPSKRSVGVQCPTRLSTIVLVVHPSANSGLALLAFSAGVYLGIFAYMHDDVKRTV
jgi:hypothetical protein